MPTFISVPFPCEAHAWENVPFYITAHIDDTDIVQDRQSLTARVTVFDGRGNPNGDEFWPRDFIYYANATFTTSQNGEVIDTKSCHTSKRGYCAVGFFISYPKYDSGVYDLRTVITYGNHTITEDSTFQVVRGDGGPRTWFKW